MAKIRPLVPELAEVAETQLQENEANTAAKIEALKTWISEQPYLTARTDDQFLVPFLRFCHWDVPEAQKRLLFYYTYKTKERELLKSRCIDDKLYEMARSGIFASLPNPIGPAGPRIHFTRMGHIDTSKHSVSEIFRFHCFRAEIELNTDDNWNISGVVEILDFTKIPYSLLLQFDAGMFKRMNAFLEHGLPTNLVGTHIVNASRETQFVLGLVRNVMRQKELLHIHPNLESLHKAIGKQYLPTEFGGENGSLNESITWYEQQFQNFTNYFQEDDKYIVDEKLRASIEKEQAPVKSTSSFRLSNITKEGSFRKFNFD